jgi:hypothetical protein
MIEAQNDTITAERDVPTLQGVRVGWCCPSLCRAVDAGQSKGGVVEGVQVLPLSVPSRGCRAEQGGCG